MPPQTQKRRRTGHRGEEEDEDNPRNRRQVKRGPESDAASQSSENDDTGDIDMDRNTGADSTSDDQLVKKLVRYALACEYARMPIRRDGIRDKVLGTHARSFRKVFDAAQEQLQKVFGMEMVELPVRERRTLKDKQSNTAEEAAYVGFYTVVISLITLSSGELSDMKLRRYLTRLNASQNLPMDKTDLVLQKLIRQGYLDKVVERVEGDEDAVTWCVGPRGKVEVSPQSIAQVIREIWGDPPDDFDKKLEKSLGVRGIGQARTTNRAVVEQDEEDE
ncbi:hypothetical protein ONZ43_g1797 [Nemania bipapillata]|uniref:Uncharacterized protein n=1 Tax=Nemania bipapillata TaxID=110536 RepID=A0ACC2J342_9PEZI|nr:hypothetical protein ONZ43_g1797 [Nemania bipapillata]